jgi:hypothetical protein
MVLDEERLGEFADAHRFRTLVGSNRQQRLMLLAGQALGVGAGLAEL